MSTPPTPTEERRWTLWAWRLQLGGRSAWVQVGPPMTRAEIAAAITPCLQAQLQLRPPLCMTPGDRYPGPPPTARELAFTALLAPGGLPVIRIGTGANPSTPANA